MNNSLEPFPTGWREYSLFPGPGSRKELWPLSRSSWSSQGKQFPRLWFLHLRACWGILGKVTTKGICRKGCLGMCISLWSRHHAFQQGKHSLPQYSARLCVQWKLGRLMVAWSDPSLPLPALLSTPLPFSLFYSRSGFLAISHEINMLSPQGLWTCLFLPPDMASVSYQFLGLLPSLKPLFDCYLCQRSFSQLPPLKVHLKNATFLFETFSLSGSLPFYTMIHTELGILLLCESPSVFWYDQSCVPSPHQE